MAIRSTAAALLPALLLASCGAPDPPVEQETNVAGSPAAGSGPQTEAGPAPPQVDGAEAAPAEAPVGACLKQGGQILPANRLKAIGTEPFWGARIEGRCVTYSTPEDQDGTRVWTQFSGSREQGVWSGFLGDQRFVLRTRPEPGCSDGMSDNIYPIAVTLTVRGEERTGCAEPL